MSWLVVGIILSVLAVDLLVHIVFTAIALPNFERKPPFGVSHSQPDERAERLSIPTTNGLTLFGCLHQHKDRTPRGLILFCHELGGNCWSAMSYAEGLWNAGFNILAFDFRNQGASEHQPGYDPLHWLTEFEVSDVLSAISYIEQRDDLRRLPLGVLGISRGGVASLAAAARKPDVKYIACESVYSTDSLLLHFTLRWFSLYAPGWIIQIFPTWHVQLTLILVRLVSQYRRGCRYTRLERWLPRLRDRQVLMIAGGRDSYVLPEITEGLCKRIGPPACDGVWVVPDAKHNMARQVQPEEYDRRLVEFFSELDEAKK